jgi:hypothetical protein
MQGNKKKVAASDKRWKDRRKCTGKRRTKDKGMDMQGQFVSPRKD